MNLEALSQKKPALLGLGQFVCGFIYISLVATFSWAMSRTGHTQAPPFLAALLMLTLLVFSATVMGTVFLGMPLYLALKGNWTKALHILGFTLLYSLAAIVLLVSSVLLYNLYV